jgi:hypothetical protein
MYNGVTSAFTYDFHIGFFLVGGQGMEKEKVLFPYLGNDLL